MEQKLMELVEKGNFNVFSDGSGLYQLQICNELWDTIAIAQIDMQTGEIKMYQCERSMDHTDLGDLVGKLLQMLEIA
jgi:hypothetical protein